MQHYLKNVTFIFAAIGATVITRISDSDSQVTFDQRQPQHYFIQYVPPTHMTYEVHSSFTLKRYCVYKFSPVYLKSHLTSTENDRVHVFSEEDKHT